MILHALTQYYQRKFQYDDASIAPEGWEKKELPFIIVLDKQGQFIQLEDTRETQGKKKIGRNFEVPKTAIRSGSKSHEISNLLWDHYGYVLAEPKEVDGTAKKTAEEIEKEQQKNQELARLQHSSFVKKIGELYQALPDDVGILAVWRFLQSPNEIKKVKEADSWKECKKIKGCNLSFRLADEPQNLVCQTPALFAYLSQSSRPDSSDDAYHGVCLITGKRAKIARLHNQIKGVNAKPAPLASVNLDAFEAYGKKQGAVFPVSETAMFEYTTALNTLLDSENRFRVGDVSVVCWTKYEHDLEKSAAQMIINPDAHIAEIKKLFKSVRNGKFTEPNTTTPFYILGLSPNVARIVVRFWHESTVADVSESIVQWHEDLSMVRSENSLYPEFMPLGRLLANLVLEGEVKNLPADLISSLTQSAFHRRPIAVSILQTALRRNKAEQRVTHGRACLIKAYLNRAVRSGSLKNTKELNMSLDKERTDIGYVLGRLFAVLEKTQSEAIREVNATIGDRYFGSASSAPIAVFGTLMRLFRHHLSKLKEGRKVNLEKLVQEIVDKFDAFPKHLDLHQQGLFAIGYYHQKQDFFIKKNQDQESNQDNQE